MALNILRNILKTALLCLIFTGCGTATLKLKDGSSREARILRSTPDTIVVQAPDDTEEQELLRSEIEDIDHPGNVMAITGGSLLLGGALLVGLGEGLTGDNSTGDGLQLIIFTLPGSGLMLTGLVLGSVGLGQWVISTNAAEGEDEVTMSLTPHTWIADGEPHYGVVWGVRW